MHLTLIGHFLEAIGAILVAIPVTSVLLAHQRIVLIDRAATIPPEIKQIINKAQRESAIWPDKIELAMMIAGFFCNFVGVLMLLSHELLIAGP